jgi:hypothetical protein
MNYYYFIILTFAQRLWFSPIRNGFILNSPNFMECQTGKANVERDRSVIPVTSHPGTLRWGCMNSIWFRCVVIAIWKLDSDNIYLSLTHLPTLQTQTEDSYSTRVPGASSSTARGGGGGVDSCYQLSDFCYTRKVMKPFSRRDDTREKQQW